MLAPCHSSWHNSLSTKYWLLVNQISNVRENLFSTSWGLFGIIPTTAYPPWIRSSFYLTLSIGLHHAKQMSFSYPQQIVLPVLIHWLAMAGCQPSKYQKGPLHCTLPPEGAPATFLKCTQGFTTQTCWQYDQASVSAEWWVFRSGKKCTTGCERSLGNTSILKCNRVKVDEETW